MMRLIIVAASVHTALYLAYADLLPTGLFRYHNIHYFKLWFPYFGLIAVFGFFQLVRSGISARGKIALLAAGSLVSLTITCLGFESRPEAIRTTFTDARTVIVEPSDGSVVKLDFIDFPDFGSDIEMRYLVGGNQLEADGRRLRRLGDFKMFKAPWGTRVFFTQPLVFQRLSITFDESFKPAAAWMTPTGFQSSIVLKRPYWFR